MLENATNSKTSQVQAQLKRMEQLSGKINEAINTVESRYGGVCRPKTGESSGPKEVGPSDSSLVTIADILLTYNKTLENAIDRLVSFADRCEL